MNRFPNRFRILYLVTIVIIGQLFSLSCNLDRCKTVACYHGGYCQLGNCVCPIGYEGPSCQTLMREKFLGNWIVFEKGNMSFSAQYPVTIDTLNTTSITQVRILNFNDSFKNAIYATVNGYNITVPSQETNKRITFGGGYIYFTTGVNYNQYSIINMAYEVIDSVNNTLINDYGYDSVADGTKMSVWNKQ